MNIYSPPWLRVTRTETTRRPPADRRLVVPVAAGIIAVAIIAALLGAIH